MVFTMSTLLKTKEMVRQQYPHAAILRVGKTQTGEMCWFVFETVDDAVGHPTTKDMRGAFTPGNATTRERPLWKEKAAFTR